MLPVVSLYNAPVVIESSDRGMYTEVIYRAVLYSSVCIP